MKPNLWYDDACFLDANVSNKKTMISLCVKLKCLNINTFEAPARLLRNRFNDLYNYNWQNMYHITKNTNKKICYCINHINYLQVYRWKISHGSLPIFKHFFVSFSKSLIKICLGYSRQFTHSISEDVSIWLHRCFCLHPK